MTDRARRPRFDGPSPETPPSRRVVSAAAATPATTASKRICEVSQIYSNKKTGNEVARISFFYDPQKKDHLMAAVRTLVDASFEKPVQVLDGEKELIKGAYKRCVGNYCYAEIETPAAQLANMGSSENLSLLFPISNGQLLRIPMASKGLTAALDALKSHR